MLCGFFELGTLTDLISLPKERLFTLKKVQKQKQIFHVTQSRFPEWKPLWSPPSPYSLSHSHQEVKLLIQTLLLIYFHIPMHALVLNRTRQVSHASVHTLLQ